MAQKDDAFQKKLLETFKVEAAEHIQALSSGLTELERAAAPNERMKVVETVFREAHSLKGAARAVAMSEIESICQAAESVFSGLKRAHLALSPALLDLLHGAVDTVAKLLQATDRDPSRKGSTSTADLLARLEAAVKNPAAAAETDTGVPTEAPQSPRPEAPEDRGVLADTVRIATPRLNALLYQAEELLSAKLTASQRAGDIREAIGALGTLTKERTRVAPALHTFRSARERSRRRNGSERSELRLQRLMEYLDWESAFLKSFEARLSTLARSAEYDRRALGAMVDGLLDDMKKALMLPVSSALEMFPKFVRDLCRDRGKEAQLLVRGGEIEIDRRILDEMKDPLIHLVRNCIDHGIETREERARRGKPPRGTIDLAVARRNGSRVEILVSDDGAGIDTGRLREAARKLGLLSSEDAGRGGDQDVLPLVFHSGVSTSPIITDLSGRGLGLAIVREKVERLGGSIAVETQPGRGTTFRMVLPLTLATFRGLHVQAGGGRFVLPTIYVEQAARLKKDEIKTVENRETIRWNGHAVALVHLADALELPRAKPAHAPGDTVQIVLLGAADRRIAFLVDEILEEREVLVKTLGRQLSRVRNIAGATVLGTGKVVPILDVPDLLRSAAKAAAAPAMAAAEGAEAAAESKSILVAEDSITARTLLKNILESAGYSVATAVDGIDGFTQLKTERFDLVVSDVDMPRMNGFDLTAKIRADKALAELPVVLVTALESREHRERGVDVGANAYIVKSSFDQSNLLEVIGSLI
ncbi:MAG: hybrid sensor histidine kinase/response regulator [Burkholderiales bacterium]|nr:hybrid sensor histidine kinase/response regulator [Burkholderiales bacterium]